MIYVGDGLPISITNQMVYVCCGPCGHTRVLCNIRLLLCPVWPHTHESGPNGLATWPGPYWPSKYCGILWYVAVIYGMRTDKNVSGIISIQVICHRQLSQQSYADICVFLYVFYNLSVLLWIYLYAGDNLPTSITNSMTNVTADVAIQETCAGNVRSPLWPVNTGRELRSGVKCIVWTIVTGSLWLVWRYRWNCNEIHLASTMPSQ